MSQTQEINFDEEEYGTCCFCGDYCNSSSQSCGGCARNLTGIAIGWNSPHSFQQHTIVVDGLGHGVVSIVACEPTSPDYSDYETTTPGYEPISPNYGRLRACHSPKTLQPHSGPLLADPPIHPPITEGNIADYYDGDEESQARMVCYEPTPPTAPQATVHKDI
jgi:hypothetical protein